MSRTSRFGILAAIAALAVIGTTSVGAAAQAEPAAAAYDITIPPAPYARTILASYGYAGSGTPLTVPSSTTSITWTLPSQFAELGLSTIAYRVYGDASAGGLARVTGTAQVDPGANSITVTVPVGFFTHPQAGTTGAPYYNFVLDVFDRETDAPAPPESFQIGNKWASSVELEGSLIVGAPTTQESFTQSLADTEAGHFEYRSLYWAVPAEPLRVVAGDAVKFDSSAISWDGNLTAVLSTPYFDPVPAEQMTNGEYPPSADVGFGATSPAAGSISTVIPYDGELAAYRQRNGSAILSASSTVGGDIITVLAPVTVATATSAAPISAARISGTDRFKTAVAISQEEYPDGAPVVYIASGANFPDALSAAPIAALSGGPLLLVPPALTGGVFFDEIRRLQPQRIVIVGGEPSVAADWESYLSGPSGATVTRISGLDRYETSRKLAEAGFPSGAKTAFLAIGTNFPDALSAVPAAVAQEAPVILVQGAGPSLDAPTLATLRKLGIENVVLLGSPAGISSSIEAQLKGLYPATGAVTRLGGSDRFATAALVGAKYFPSAPEMFLTSGLNFPDALAGGVLAARRGAPLLLAIPSCVPKLDLQSMRASSTSNVTLFGSEATLGPQVMDLDAC